jgi:type V secretory pathway adhesin AidA
VNNTIFASDVGIVIGGGGYYHTSGPNDYSTVANNIVFDNSEAGIVENGNTGIHNTYRNNLVFRSGKDWGLKNGLTHSGVRVCIGIFLAIIR